jgi:FtsH-binding integral membrane protein
MNYGIAQSSSFVSMATQNVRADFIRRVYGYFFTSILVTVGVGALCSLPGIREPLMGLMMVLCVAQLIVCFALHFTKRTTGVNLALFMLFASLWGAILGPLLALVGTVAPGVPMQAAMLTTAVFGGLTLYVFQSKKDFSFLGGMLFVGLIALIITGILLIFFAPSALYLLYCFGGVILFSGFVLYDTSQIMHHLYPDEAITGAIELYLDFLNLFMFILRILLIFSGRDE